VGLHKVCVGLHRNIKSGNVKISRKMSKIGGLLKISRYLLSSKKFLLV